MDPYSPSATPNLDKVGSGINKFLDFFVSDNLQDGLIVIKIVFIIISAIFIFLIVYFITHSEYMKWLFVDDVKNFFSPRKFRKRTIMARWEKMKANLNKAKTESQWKLSLIEALVVIDDNLRQIGYTGETLTEKFSSLTQEDVPNINELLEVSKTCQDVVKDPNYKIEKSEVLRIFDILERALSELEIL